MSIGAVDWLNRTIPSKVIDEQKTRNKILLELLLNDGLISKNDFCLLSIPLTAREEEILSCYSKGYSSREVGIKLNLSPRTVEGRIGVAKEKFNVITRSALMAEFRKWVLLQILSGKTDRVRQTYIVINGDVFLE